MSHARRLAAMVLAAAICRGAAAADAPYYAALFADGTYLAAGRLTDWHDERAQPKLSGRPLFDPARPVVFLRNTAMAADREPPAVVEMFGGDRFVGAVTGFVSGEESFYRREAEEMIVKPAVDVSLPETPRPAEVRVLTRWAKRIVWQRRFAARYTPATLYYRDGREVAFRRVRFAPRSVLLLVESGLLEAPIDEIAELHLPRIDPWRAYFEQLALLGDADARLVRVETDTGLRLTTSTARFRTRHWGDAADANNWYRLIQPVWCRTPLVVPQKHVHTMRWHAAHEVPLSMIEPEAIEQKSALGGGWSPRIDRSVRDAPLSTGGRESAWGVGVHAECRIAFPLDEAVRSFRTAVGLDASVGDGGCARAIVYLDDAKDKPLFASGHLIGSRRRVETGPLGLDLSPDKQYRLVLVADAAHEDRPAGADPFDIRDHVDWCEPTLELDRAKLAAAVADRAGSLVPAWDGWNVEVGGDTLPLADRWIERQSDVQRYVCEVSGGRPVALWRTMRVENEHRYLMLCVEQTEAEGKTNEIAVSVDGKPYATLEISRTAWNGAAPTPRLIPVEALRGREVAFRIDQNAASEKNRVAWRRIALVAAPAKTNWTTLIPRSATSADGASLVAMPDGSILASGRAAERDRYTIEFETKLRGVTAIRIEALLDQTLPRGGPGRGGDGRFVLSEVKLAARNRGDGNAAGPAESTDASIAAVSADYYEQRGEPENVIDGKAETGWNSGAGAGKPHAIVLALAADPTSPDGTIFTLVLDQQAGGRQTLGRFRVSATTEPLPAEAEQLGRRIATLAEASPDAPPRRKMLFNGQPKLIESLVATEGKASRQTGERFAGGASLKVAGGAAENAAIADWNVPIRCNPGEGEFRYLRFAWRKRGGGGATLHLADAGKWRSAATGTERPLCYSGGDAVDADDGTDSAIVVQRELPDEWTVVTRDLYADFGPITLTGLRISCPDGEYVLLDAMQVARSLDDFERAGP